MKDPFTRSKQIYRTGRSLKFCGIVHRQQLCNLDEHRLCLSVSSAIYMYKHLLCERLGWSNKIDILTLNMFILKNLLNICFICFLSKVLLTTHFKNKMVNGKQRSINRIGVFVWTHSGWFKTCWCLVNDQQRYVLQILSY